MLSDDTWDFLFWWLYQLFPSSRRRWSILNYSIQDVKSCRIYLFLSLYILILNIRIEKKWIINVWNLYNRGVTICFMMCNMNKIITKYLGNQNNHTLVLVYRKCFDQLIWAIVGYFDPYLIFLVKLLKNGSDVHIKLCGLILRLSYYFSCL